MVGGRTVWGFGFGFCCGYGIGGGEGGVSGLTILITGLFHASLLEL